METKHWHTLDTKDIIIALSTDERRGLSSQEADIRLKKYGPNKLAEKEGESPLFLFIGQFRNFIVWVLIGAAIVSGILGEWLDATAIVAIVILNAILGFVQEYRAEKSLAALKKLSSPSSRVIRNGEITAIPSGELVPGDLVELEAGSLVPADARLNIAFNLRTQEASLTGESTPVDKTIDPLTDASIPIGDRKNMVFMGTSVASGKGRAFIVETGMSTQLGRIAGLIQEAGRGETPLQKKLSDFGKWLVYGCLGVVTMVFVLGLIRGGELLEMFLVSVSLAVAAIPEGLPAIVTIALALGVHRMVKRNALIRKLPSVETLGCATVICSDKTGTLTQNEMTVRKIYADGQTIEVSGSGYSPVGDFLNSSIPISIDKDSGLKLALETGVLCNSSYLSKKNGMWTVVGDPTEGALLSAAGKAGIWKDELEGKYPLVWEIPFDSQRKKMATVRKGPLGMMVYEKGAPDVVLEDCSKIFDKGVTRLLTKKDKEEILEKNTEFARGALRVLGFACRVLGDEPQIKYDSSAIERDMVFVGLLAMMDPPRPEAKLAVEKCHKAGINVVMITGDHKNTALAIAEELGISRKEGHALDGAEMEGLTDEVLERDVENISVYARVSAEHKLRIVRALRKRGEVVAMTGDGVNDAPAIKEADIGVAMGITGTDVTKEASDMVITDDNFASIVAAVEEGRGIYDNIKKFIHYLLSCNAGEVMVMFFSSLLGLPMPLFPIQILWINMATDGLPALALGVDPIDPNIMNRPSRRTDEGIVSKSFFSWISVQGFVMALSTLLAFIYVLDVDVSEFFGCCSVDDEFVLARARTVAFSVLVFTQLFHAFNCRNGLVSIFKIGILGNKKLVFACAISAFLQFAIVQTPFLNKIFNTVPLRAVDWLYIFIASSFIIWVMEGIKFIKAVKATKPVASKG
ncbi:MAG: cation-translocating P-type ATPase [Planctomycetes bacterium]|nr:cation-translocating P-type ATPase [Planctomycetota bacterium]